MTQDSLPHARGLRAGAAVRCAVVTLGLLLGSLSAPALAAPPTSWENDVAKSPLEIGLVLVGIPLAIIAVITLLMYLPVLRHHRGSSKVEPALVFAEHSEWIGGPREGLDSLPEGSTGATAASEVAKTGGASARW